MPPEYFLSRLVGKTISEAEWGADGGGNPSLRLVFEDGTILVLSDLWDWEVENPVTHWLCVTSPGGEVEELTLD